MSRGGGARHTIASTAVMLLFLLFVKPVHGQSGEWPTLSGAGLEYLSRSGMLQIGLSGQLDLEGLHVRDSWAGLIARQSDEVPLSERDQGCATCHVGMGVRGEGGALQVYRLRVFTDIFVGDHIYSLIEFRSDRGHAPSDGDIQARVEQAYVRVAVGDGASGVQVGRFASPFGAYSLRHLSTVDPFLRPPLAYDYRTLMSRGVVPRNAEILSEWKHVPRFFRKPGTPPVWDVPYQWGAMAFGRLGPLDVRLAAMNSAPSSTPAAWGLDWERLERPSWVVAVRSRPTADLDVGMSYNRGPWMEPLTAGTINRPPDSDPEADPPGWRDFDQEIISADMSFARGPMTLRAEAMLDRWSVPNLEHPVTERLYGVELQWDLLAGVFAAGRVGHIDFRPLAGVDAERAEGSAEWDSDVSRFEASLGYRLARNAGLIVSAYEQIQAREADADSRFVGVRIWWAF